MVKQLRLAIGLAITATLVACGGGGDSGGGSGSNTQTLYGAIAYRDSYVTISSKQTSQSNANALALNSCGSNCQIVLEFVGQKCGGTARALGITTWASADTGTAAIDAAKLECINRGGQYCNGYISSCNY
jgi:hypothetical protein